MTRIQARLSNILSRVRNEWHDLFEMVLVPSLSIFLPWGFCYRVFRWICRFDFLYQEETNEAFAQASARGWMRMDPKVWRQTSRLVTLIDFADFFLSRTRSDNWMKRHLLSSGKWPAPGDAALLFTFHWGAGMWALRHMGYYQLRAHAIVSPHVRENFIGRTVRYVYFGARNRENTRALLGTEPIPAQGSQRKILQTLKEKQQIIAAVDVPSDQAAASERIQILGLSAKVPRGLFRVAVDQRIPVYVFLTGIRIADGKRTLDIHEITGEDDLQRLMNSAFLLLEKSINQEPPAWHFWKVAPRFFT